VVIVKRVVAWLKALFQWITEPHLVWMALLVVVLAGIIAIHAGVSEIQARLTGLVLQLLGLLTVVYGIRETRKLFGRPSFRQLLREWLSRFPRWRRDAFIYAGSGAMTISGGSATAHVWSNIDPAAPIEERVNALTRNVERMNERIIHIQKENDAELRKHTESLRQEQESRKEGDDQLNMRLEAAETGGLHISFIGVIWIFLGLILSTVSPEIAQWMR
jgi:hypothetical protein